jgi:predicted transposase YdaD
MLMAVNWRDSTTYQAILREGREQGRNEGRLVGAQRILVRLGMKGFGMPNGAILVAIEATRDIERLEDLADRVIDPDVRDWDEWLGTS